MTAATTTAAEFQSHPNIGAIYDDMLQETTASSPVPSTMRVKAFTVSTKTFDGATDAPVAAVEERGTNNNNNFVTISTKTFDGTNNRSEKRSFSRKNSTDSMLSEPHPSSSSIRPMDRNVAKRRGSTDSAFSIYNDDDLWSQRIGEIMTRGIGGVLPSSTTPVQQQQHSSVEEHNKVRVSSSSHTKFRRCQSTECPSTNNSPSSSSSRHYDRESAWVKKQQFGGKTLSRRNSIDGGKGVLLSRTNSRSTSPKYIPPINSFPSDDGSRNAPTTTTTNVGALSRRNSMTRRSRSPKFVEPLSSSDHDVSREFNGGKIRRHTLAGGVNPFITVTSTTSHQQKDDVLREKRTIGEEDEGGNDGYIIEQVKIVLESLEEPSTPKSAVKTEQRTAVVPKKPFSRHNSIEGVDPSIFPSLPLDDSNTDSYDTDPNLDLALLFDHLVKEDETDVATSEDDEEEEEKIIQKHIKSKIRRRCSTGGLRTFERENFRNFIEDMEGEEPVRRSVPHKVDGRSSLYRKCSTGGLRTLKRENSKDLYSDDCSLDGKKDGVHVSNDPSFDAYLRKMTQEAVVDTSGDANIIDQRVGTSRRRSSIRSVSSFVAGSEDPVDFADFLSRVGQGIPSSQVTVSTAANTSYAEDCCENPREVESVLASSVKKKLPRSIQAPMDESVSSLENSFKGKGSPLSPVKHSAEVNFRSSKSRSIRRLASNDGIKELSKLAQGTEPSTTRRGSCGGIRTPDPEEIVLEDLPRLIKNIDRDLVTERAAYQQRRSSGSGPVSGKKASVMNKGRTGVQRKQLEPPGTSVSEMKAQQTECIPKGEAVPVPSIVLRYKPKRRRSSTQSISEDKQRFGEPGNVYNERRRKEQAKA